MSWKPHLLVLALAAPSAALLRVGQPVVARRSATVAMADASAASVLFIVEGERASPFGATSPQPSPSWRTVAAHMARRIPDFDERLSAGVVDVADLEAWSGASGKWDLLVALGVTSAAAAQTLVDASNKARSAALLCQDCDPAIAALQRVGNYYKTPGSGAAALLQAARTTAAPWSTMAQGKRLSEQVDLLFSRHSSEDLLYALFFVLHARTIEIDLVRYTINPTWEKGLIQNAAEFANMINCCGDKIFAAISDPDTKATIDLLNKCDSRDQVGSYRVIVSYETPQLEDFSLCILQQNNVFGCDASILTSPRVPLLRKWQGRGIDEAMARQILIGHLDHPEAATVSQKKPWSWKVVCGANPAYDTFPAQHQVFYPSERSAAAIWYDPVFKVETLDGRQVWTKRHYRCTPRHVDDDLQGEDGSSFGAWTFSTLDNGIISKEYWTTVDAADDLSWVVLHYSGAAAVVGQSYLGGLLCSADGKWPASAREGKELERIRLAFDKCGIQLWELYGHGPPGESSDSGPSRSFMWTDAHDKWAIHHPPPLEPIGDQSVQAWRKAEKERLAAKSRAKSTE